MLAEDLKNDSFWPQNHVFTLTTPKPGYIYPNNFSWENFSKIFFAPLGPPWGTWGPYLKKGSVKYFPNVFFWTSWAPWVSPYPHMLCNQPKNLKIFQGAVIPLNKSYHHRRSARNLPSATRWKLQNIAYMFVKCRWWNWVNTKVYRLTSSISSISYDHWFII